MSDAARVAGYGAGGRGTDAVLQARREGVPARIMVPRVIYVVCSLGLLFFGLLMIYSASSITGLTSKAYGNDPAYFVIRQAGFAFAGLVAAAVLARVDYHVWAGPALRVAWVITLLSLLFVYTPVAGHDAYGATRWVAIGPFTLQPSEFAKVTVLLTGAHIADEYTKGNLEDRRQLAILLGVGVVAPMLLILLQPDKGTTGVLGITLLVMLYLSGFPLKRILMVLGFLALAAAVLALKDEYSRARVMTILDPFGDEYGAGYQLVQGFYALGSGGATGVGLGMSHQKYNYLPMAYNDFIFAVIGEELGFVGAALMIAAFGLLLWAGFKIAENAPDLTGRLIAAGCSTLLVVQMLLNVSGVLGAFPLSGKPIPFVSYGGSSVISSLMLAGLVVSVSLRSKLPETRYDRRRAQLRISESDDVRPSLSIVEGGLSRSSRRTERANVRPTTLKRVDLGPSAADRLRGTRNRRS